jgi:hypothetical protein
MRRVKRLTWITCAVAGILSCSEAPLNEKRFTALLIDLHTADAMLSDARVAPVGEREKYLYYNDLFEKHGITRVEFDSCVHYYSGQPARYARIYDAVLKTLGERDTANQRVWARLTREDTVNLARLFLVRTRDTLLSEVIWYDYTIIDTLHAVEVRERLAVPDTLWLDDINRCYRVDIDIPRVGRYELHARVKFDTITANAHVRPRFIFPAGDTLHAREVVIRGDTLARDYHWSYYLSDSTCSRLSLQLVERDSADRAGGWITGVRLYRKYLPPKEALRVIEQQRAWEERGR